MARKANKTSWKKGQSGNPAGRPPRAVEADYLEALRAGVSMELWRAIVHRAALDAVKGDDRARAWLARYLLPSESVAEPSDTERLFLTLLEHTND